MAYLFGAILSNEAGFVFALAQGGNKKPGAGFQHRDKFANIGG
jgi:hypothetical protein